VAVGGKNNWIHFWSQTISCKNSITSAYWIPFSYKIIQNSSTPKFHNCYSILFILKQTYFKKWKKTSLKPFLMEATLFRLCFNQTVKEFPKLLLVVRISHARRDERKMDGNLFKIIHFQKPFIINNKKKNKEGNYCLFLFIAAVIKRSFDAWKIIRNNDEVENLLRKVQRSD